MNKVILHGRLGDDPTVIHLEKTQLCKFSLATSRSYKKDGEKHTQTQWHRCVAWGKQADTIAQYVSKGDSLMIVGRIEYGEYEKEGVKRYTTDIVIEEFNFVGSRSNSNQKQDQELQDQEVQEVDVLPDTEDDDLPF